MATLPLALYTYILKKRGIVSFLNELNMNHNLDSIIDIHTWFILEIPICQNDSSGLQALCLLNENCYNMTINWKQQLILCRDKVHATVTTIGDQICALYCMI